MVTFSIAPSCANFPLSFVPQRPSPPSSMCLVLPQHRGASGRVAGGSVSSYGGPWCCPGLVRAGCRLSPWAPGALADPLTDGPLAQPTHRWSPSPPCRAPRAASVPPSRPRLVALVSVCRSSSYLAVQRAPPSVGRVPEALPGTATSAAASRSAPRLSAQPTTDTLGRFQAPVRAPRGPRPSSPGLDFSLTGSA